MLSRDNILEEIIDGGVEIYPFERSNLTGIGYNLSITDFAFSINEGNLLTVNERVTPGGTEHYVMVPPNDTVLLFSKEYIAVSNRIAGTFHSKVARVCQGFGHVSTTLDPTWRGQLIISVNNPTSGIIELSLDGKSGNMLTMLLYRLETPVTGPNIHDNNQGRCDLLLSRLSGPPKKRKWKRDYAALKHFITDQYADSLNGYDDFLGPDAPRDKYSVRADMLLKLRDRIERDRAWIVDRSYLNGESQVRGIAKTPKEADVLRSCTLFQILESIDPDKCEKVLRPIDVWSEEAHGEALKRMDFCLRALEYELQSINHQRRVDWQNNRVLEFAGADTEFAKARRNKARTDFIRDHNMALAFLAFITIACAAIIVCRMFLNLDFPYAGELLTCGISIFSAIVSVVLKDWADHRKGLNEWPMARRRS